MRPTVADAFVLFGATGDLAQRMLLPSLYELHVDGLLEPGLEVLGLARGHLDDAAYRRFAQDALLRHVAENRRTSRSMAAFLGRLHYQACDLSRPVPVGTIGDRLSRHSRRNVAVLLSTAPSLFESAISALKLAGLAGENARIAVEKPLGDDLAASRRINDSLKAVFPEERTFRIDHYLGKETVQNLLALRFGNALFEPLWNASAIDCVQITVAETIGLEGRGEFYDGLGALRDMVQSHMLQLLALVAMEPPAHFDSMAIRDEKVKVLRSLRAIDRASATTHSVTGQYGPGTVGGVRVRSYAEELGRDSESETFVALKVHVDNWRWKGVPFHLRTGKRMPSRQTEIFIRFKPVPHSIFAERNAPLEHNKLIIRLQPEENVRLLVMAKVPGLDHDGVRLKEVPLDLSLTHAFSGTRRRIAYERLLLDFIEGDTTLFVHRDEVEAQWAWIDQIREGWKRNMMRPRPYDAGTWGPSAAIALADQGPRK